MSADEQGNDLGAVGIPVTGAFGFAPLAAANVISSLDGGSRDLALSTEYPAYKKLGLIKNDGGFEDGAETGDPTEFFQKGYKLAGDDELTFKVGLAQTDAFVRQLIRDSEPDENGRILVRGASSDKLWLGFKEVVYKPVNGATKGLLERHNGVFRITELERDQAERGSVRGWNATCEWVPHEWFEDAHCAEWFLYPDTPVVTPPAGGGE